MLCLTAPQENFQVVLDQNVRRYLARHVKSEEGSHSLVLRLPKLMKWNRHAFSPQKATSGIVGWLLPYLTETVAVKARTVGLGNVKVKWNPFDWKVRFSPGSSGERV